MKRTLVTGGAGFVGANLVRRLLAEGHEVHLWMRPGTSLWRVDSVLSDVTLHSGSFQDPESLSRALKNIRPDWVFHLAAHGAYSWQTDLQAMIETNVLGTVNLIRACLETGFEAFIAAGSSSEYGFKDHAPSEEEACEPASDYAWSKLSAALYARYAARRFEKPIVTLRLYSVFGPYEEPGRLIPALLAEGAKGKLPPLVRPETAHDFVYVDDVCEAFLLAASHPQKTKKGIYNVGTGFQTEMRHVVDVARRVMALNEEPVWNSMPGRGWDTSIWMADPRRIKEDLGWAPKHDFESGFRKAAQWYRNDPASRKIYEQNAAPLRSR